jgi:probable F420-dependent oxidoreductase
MHVGLGMPSHGFMRRGAHDSVIQPVAFDEMNIGAISERAEELGYRSLWFGDHVVMEVNGAENYPGNRSGRRPYGDRHDLLDPVIGLTIAALATNTIMIGTAVLVCPYRHPLVVAHQLACLDRLSNGRLIVGVGTGWMRGEFDALGVPFDERVAMTEECLQVYNHAWTADELAFDGRFFQFSDVTLNPKPMQTPRPRLLYGGTTVGGARRAVRHCDGLMPTLKEPTAGADRFEVLRGAVREEAIARGREMRDFELWVSTAAELLPSRTRASSGAHKFMSGSREELLNDLGELAAHGYRHAAIHFEVPSGSANEFLEIIEEFATEVLPEAEKIKPLSWP